MSMPWIFHLIYYVNINIDIALCIHNVITLYNVITSNYTCKVAIYNEVKVNRLVKVESRSKNNDLFKSSPIIDEKMSKKISIDDQ